MQGASLTPYYDALDGLPAYLHNDGQGTIDGTAQAGLRRTYSASLVDLDGDHDRLGSE